MVNEVFQEVIAQDEQSTKDKDDDESEKKEPHDTMDKKGKSVISPLPPPVEDSQAISDLRAELVVLRSENSELLQLVKAQN